MDGFLADRGYAVRLALRATRAWQEATNWAPCAAEVAEPWMLSNWFKCFVGDTTPNRPPPPPVEVPIYSRDVTMLWRTP